MSDRVSRLGLKTTKMEKYPVAVSEHFYSMLKNLILLSTIVVAGGCRVSKENKGQPEHLTEIQLKSDIDYAYSKLSKYHPQLHRFISADRLRTKFDSLRASFHTSLTVEEFYFQLSPLIASVKQGHTRLHLPYFPQKEQRKELSGLKYNPAFPFVAKLINGKLYISKDLREHSKIQSGTEIVSMNGLPLNDLLRQYKTSISLDGFNETWAGYAFISCLTNYIEYQNGIQPSSQIHYQLRFKDEVKTVNFRFEPVDVVSREAAAEKQHSDVPQVKETAERPVAEVRPAFISKQKSLSLYFLNADRSTALLDIRNFNDGSYKKFYAECYQLLFQSKTRNLIIDLRGNGGGNLDNARELYSYLVDSSFRFTQPFELTSRGSLLTNFRYINNSTSFLKRSATGIVTLFGLVPSIKMNVRMHKAEDKKYYFAPQNSRLNKAKKNGFHGKLYVLINGGTFSAASIFAANLKGSQRALLVGEETGGAQNGCVAGLLPEIILPNSRLNLRFGLYYVQPHFVSLTDGRGVFPDVEVKPGLTDLIKNRNAELRWVLKDLAK